MLFRLIHRLLNPHCRECAAEELANRVCSSCETLKAQLEIANYEKRQLLSEVLQFKRFPDGIPVPIQKEELKPVLPRTLSWYVKRQMLEEEDRRAAAVIKERATAEAEAAKHIKETPVVRQNLTVDELEKELGVEETPKEGVQ